jgi:hypothetical protein
MAMSTWNYLLIERRNNDGALVMERWKTVQNKSLEKKWTGDLTAAHAT